MMRLLTLALVCFVALVALGGCGSASWHRVDVELLGDGSGTGGSMGGVVGSEIFRGRPYIFVSVNGHRAEKFLFDTGAPIHSLTPEAAERFGVTAKKTILVGDVNGNWKKSPSGVAESVVFGPVVQRGATMLIVERNRLGSSDVAGTIGMNGLQGYTIDFDFPSDRISITNERIDPLMDGVVPFKTDDYAVPYVPLGFVGLDSVRSRQMVWATLDTGFMGDLMLDRGASKKWADGERSKREGFAVGAHDVPWDIQMSAVQGGIVIGGMTVQGIQAVVDQQDTILGSGLIRNFRVRIDGVSKLVSFEGIGQSAELVGIKYLGIRRLYRMRRHGEQYRIFGVVPGSHAELAGLRAHDQVISIDGRMPSDLVGLDYWPIEPGAREIRIRVRRRVEGERVEMEIVLALGGG